VLHDAEEVVTPGGRPGKGVSGRLVASRLVLRRKCLPPSYAWGYLVDLHARDGVFPEHHGGAHRTGARPPDAHARHNAADTVCA
jgi:hypothetical protein